MASAYRCIFCKIAAREAPASIVAEDDIALAFLDIRPINEGHTLVIPKEHASYLSHLTPAVGERVFAMAMTVASGLRKSGLRCEGVNLHLADGEAAGQEIPHVHVHVIPRFEGDGFGIRVGPHYGRLASESELKSTAAKIRSAMTIRSST